MIYSRIPRILAKFLNFRERESKVRNTTAQQKKERAVYARTLDFTSLRHMGPLMNFENYFLGSISQEYPFGHAPFRTSWYIRLDGPLSRYTFRC